MTDALLETKAVAKSYGSVVALRSVDLTVQPGEIHALLGANGAGKSTLVKILSGVIAPDSGTISVNGRSVTMRRPPEALKAGLATVYQDPALVPDLTIAQNLTLTAIDEDAVRSRLTAMGLGRLDFDAQIRDLPLEVLRLLDLARALAHDPQLLLLDEITAALPSDQAEHVFGIMQEWKEKGRSVLFITHRLAEVLSLCDQATILRDGRTVAQVEPRQSGERGLVTPMLGEVAAELEAATSRVISQEAPINLATADLYSGGKVNGISFELRAGEILGIAALEGQGQDRLFELLSGDRRPDRGEVIVNGSPLRARSPYDAIRRGVVLVPSDRVLALLPKRSVRENLAIPLYNRVQRWLGLVGDEDTRTNKAIERLSIDTRAHRQVRRLSGGNQQKVVIGRWLANGFRTLLCFDPTRGIDIHTKRQIYDLLKEVADTGASVLVYTSELPEIPLLCDRVLVIYNGRIVHEQDAANATEEVLLSAAHGLEESA
ncbi:MAG: sugar ABC transporter ATP-binding protein [Acidimicrobiia bacterium]|nr:sugar ABC transporter ATP-binding protein [Acidimicrobiia bacterium]MDQ3500115.1 sugar ABC transporter ATP-binding protein [Actinomycetota bacterium]